MMVHLDKQILSDNKGFTLTELALVFAVIGFITAIFLGGEQMIENARILRTIKGLENYRVQVEAFYGTYKQLPGDLVDAHLKIPKCQNSVGDTKVCDTVKLSSNAGDGVVGMPKWDFLIFQEYNLLGLQPKTGLFTDYYGYYAETILFWFELERAGFIQGEVTDWGVSGDTTDVRFGESLPASPLRGGYWVGNSDGSSASNYFFGRPDVTDPMTGNAMYSYPEMGTVLMTVNQVDPVDYYTNSLNSTHLEDLAGNADPVFYYPNIQPLKPSWAAQIDRKLDDGMPLTGRVQGYGVPNSCFYSSEAGNGIYTYNEGVDSYDCGLIISIYK